MRYQCDPTMRTPFALCLALLMNSASISHSGAQWTQIGGEMSSPRQGWTGLDGAGRWPELDHNRCNKCSHFSFLACLSELNICTFCGSKIITFRCGMLTTSTCSKQYLLQGTYSPIRSRHIGKFKDFDRITYHRNRAFVSTRLL